MARGFASGMNRADAELQAAFKTLHAHSESADIRIAQRGGLFFAAGIAFLVLAGVFGFTNPMPAFLMAILCAVSLTVGMYYLSPH